MKTKIKRTLFCLSVLAALFLLPAFSQNSAAPVTGRKFTGDGQLKFPEALPGMGLSDLGFDMSYSPAMKMGHHMFDNVFVNPEAYKAFVETGAWPDRPCCSSKYAAQKTKAQSIRWAIIRALKPWGSRHM